eukprot:15475667-Alexandrium_andersonii.AAC.1
MATRPRGPSPWAGQEGDRRQVGEWRSPSTSSKCREARFAAWRSALAGFLDEEPGDAFRPGRGGGCLDVAAGTALAGDGDA